MLQKTVDFDLRKWASYDQGIIQPYIHEIIKDTLKEVNLEPDKALYRGGFGQKEDLERLLRTGSDYETFSVNLPDSQKAAGIYAVPLEYVGSEPWCRGLDPLFWALKGHLIQTNKSTFQKYWSAISGLFNKEGRWNPLNTLVAYRKSEMVTIPISDIIAFKNLQPTPDAVAAVINLNLRYKKEVTKMSRDSLKQFKMDAKENKKKLKILAHEGKLPEEIKKICQEQELI